VQNPVLVSAVVAERQKVRRIEIKGELFLLRNNPGKLKKHEVERKGVNWFVTNNLANK